MIRGTPLPATPGTLPAPAASRTAAAGNNLLPFDPLAIALPVGSGLASLPVPAIPAEATTDVAIAIPRASRHPSPADACFPLPAPAGNATFDPPMLELHVEHAGGRIEVLSLPWRLAPSGTLSQRYDEVASSASGRAPAAFPVVAAPIAAPGTPSPASAISATATASSSDGDGDAHAQSLLVERAPTPVHEAAEDDPLSHARQAAPQAQPWLERLYRWAERAGVEPSLWIRDYRLGPEQVHDLVSTLQALARERGVALRRIVVNGREAWHAAAPASTHPPYRNQED